MSDHDPVVESLRELGSRPVDPVTASRHLGQMVSVRPRTPLSTKIKIGAAFGVGFLVGGTGLAAAGGLPAPAQNVAHRVLSTVGVGVPGGPQRYNGPECGPNADYKNHGQYVRTHHGDPDAARSRCGKPVQAGSGTDSPDHPDASQGQPGAAQDQPDAAQDHGGGPPGTPHGKGHGESKDHGDGSSAPGDDGPSGTTGEGGSSAATPQGPAVPIAPTTTTTIPAPPTTTSTSSTTTTSTTTTSTTVG